MLNGSQTLSHESDLSCRDSLDFSILSRRGSSGVLLGLVRSHAVGEAGVGRPGAATFMWETVFHLDCGACVVV